VVDNEIQISKKGIDGEGPDGDTSASESRPEDEGGTDDCAAGSSRCER